MENLKRKALELIFIGMFGALCACSRIQPQPEKPQWPCDPQADAAVEQDDWQTALLQHQEFLLENPTDCVAMYHLGYVWGRLGEREKEIQNYEAAIACGYDKDDLLYFNLGMAYGELDQLDEALKTFERAIALKPENADNYFGLALTAYSAGQREMAMEALNKAVSVNPQYWDARIEMARIYLDEGRLSAARDQLEAVQKGAPEHEELQTLWQIYADRKITAYDPDKK